MALLPADIPTGRVTGQFYFVNEDTIADGDALPQLQLVTGGATFTASVPTLSMITKSVVLVPLEFNAKFNADGHLVPEDWMSGEVGMELPATNSTAFDRTGWTWTLNFDLREAGTNRTVRLNPITLPVRAGETIDLSEVSPVQATPGVVQLRGEKGQAVVILEDPNDPGAYVVENPDGLFTEDPADSGVYILEV